MVTKNTVKHQPAVLITGAAKRVGATIVRHLHHLGMNIILHYHTSQQEAESLQNELNQQRSNSVQLLQADLAACKQFPKLLEQALSFWGQLDVLINNASSFFPTPLGSVTEEQWQNLMVSNLQAPFFLAQACAPHLRQQQGCIINITDIHAHKPLKNYSVYSMAKAGLKMMTKSLAKELGPDIRVNAIAPGAVLWPDTENELSSKQKEKIINKATLKCHGTPQDIANAVEFFITKADYITGQILKVDGGR